jgi:hypothetical protein
MSAFDGGYNIVEMVAGALNRQHLMVAATLLKWWLEP